MKRYYLYEWGKTADLNFTFTPENRENLISFTVWLLPLLPTPEHKLITVQFHGHVSSKKHYQQKTRL